MENTTLVYVFFIMYSHHTMHLQGHIHSSYKVYVVICDASYVLMIAFITVAHTQISFLFTSGAPET